MIAWVLWVVLSGTLVGVLLSIPLTWLFGEHLWVLIAAEIIGLGVGVMMQSRES